MRRMYARTSVFPPLCALVILAIGNAASAGPRSEVPADIRAAFERAYQAYLQAPATPDPRSFQSRTQREVRLDEIARLGLPALPLVMDKLRGTRDDSLSYAINRISRKHFVASEYPEGKFADPAARAQMYLDWWDVGYAGTAERFEQYYGRWKKAKSGARVLQYYEFVYDDSTKTIQTPGLRYTEAGEVLRALEGLGIAALPFMMEKIKEGDYDMLPAIAELTEDKALKAHPPAGQPVEERARGCLEWWEKNKEQWTIPFPDAAEAAAAAGAPPAPKAVEPAPPATPAKGQMSPEARAAKEAALENARKAVEEARKRAAEAEAQPAPPAQPAPAPH
jgi:hypothetical protein